MVERLLSRDLGVVPSSARWQAVHLFDRFISDCPSFDVQRDSRKEQLRGVAIACCALALRVSSDVKSPTRADLITSYMFRMLLTLIDLCTALMPSSFAIWLTRL